MASCCCRPGRIAAGAPDLTRQVEAALAEILAAETGRGHRCPAGSGPVSAPRPIFGLRDGHARRRHVGLIVMVALAALWLGLASRVHVNASWSDEAWGYAAFPLFGEDPKIGDRVLFDPPEALESRVPYLKTVRSVPGMAVTVGGGTERSISTALRSAGPRRMPSTGGPLEAIAPGIIPPGHYFLHADHPDSHDSRYAGIGLVPRNRILGRAVALPDLPLLGLKGAAGRAGRYPIGCSAGGAAMIRCAAAGACNRRDPAGPAGRGEGPGRARRGPGRWPSPTCCSKSRPASWNCSVPARWRGWRRKPAPAPGASWRSPSRCRASRRPGRNAAARSIPPLRWHRISARRTARSSPPPGPG